MIHRRDWGRSCRAMLAVSIAFGLAATDVQAETGSASAKDVAIHINILGIASLDVDPQAAVDFVSATVPTDLTDSLPSLDIGSGLLLHLGTGLTQSEVEYDPGQPLSSATADTSIADVDLSAVTPLGGGLLSIHADLIESSSGVLGWCRPDQQRGASVRGHDDFHDIEFLNGFDETNLMPGGPGDPGDGSGGNVVFVNPGVSILGIPVPNLPTLPAPNTSIDLSALGIAGATLILNERTITGDGIAMSSMVSNALRLSLNVAGLVTADVVLGHSEAKLDCTE
jgi:hypothetical protein